MKHCGQATGLRQHLSKREPLSLGREEISPILPSLLTEDFIHKMTRAIWKRLINFTSVGES